MTDDDTLAAAGFPALAAEILRAGGASIALHLRGPATPVRRLLARAEALAPEAAASGARLLINDRVDVALAVGADGVHLGSRGMPAADARALLGPDRLVGASVHGAAQAAREGRGADYLIAGTLFPTPSHPGRPGSGTGWLAELAGTGIPVIGIGGVTPPRAAQVRTAGAHGVAVLRGVWGAARPLESLAAYLAALNGEWERE